MAIGRYTERVAFVRKGRTQTADGSYTASGATLATVWADMRELPTRETTEAGRMYGSQFYELTMHRDDLPADLSNADLAEWEGSTLQIRGIELPPETALEVVLTLELGGDHVSKVQGGSQLRRQLRQLGPDATREIRDVFEKQAPLLRNDISAGAPKDKGDLAQTAHYQVSRDGLGMAVGYSQNRSGFKRFWKRGGFTALWQEFGTRKHAAQPFISPAFHRRLPTVVNRIQVAVLAVLRRAGQ